MFAKQNDENTFEGIDTYCQIVLENMKNEGLDF